MSKVANSSILHTNYLSMRSIILPTAFLNGALCLSSAAPHQIMKGYHTKIAFVQFVIEAELGKVGEGQYIYDGVFATAYETSSTCNPTLEGTIGPLSEFNKPVGKIMADARAGAIPLTEDNIGMGIMKSACG